PPGRPDPDPLHARTLEHRPRTGHRGSARKGARRGKNGFPMKILPIVLGVLLLVAGRRLYWLFVGAVGFLIGMRIAERFFPQEGSWQYLLIVVLAGLAGVLLAMVIQRIAVLLAGAL